jgi:hypothetical protein
MVVTIARDQTVYLGDTPVNVHDLPLKLRHPGQDQRIRSSICAPMSACPLEPSPA